MSVSPHRSSRRAAALAAACWLSLWPQLGAAGDGVCAPRAAEPAETAGSLREKASYFMPSVSVRAWFRPNDTARERGELAPSALSTLPEPVQRQRRFDRPVEWRVGVQWDIIEVAQGLEPQLWRDADRLEASGCRRQLLDELTLPTQDERLELLLLEGLDAERIDQEQEEEETP